MKSQHQNDELAKLQPPKSCGFTQKEVFDLASKLSERCKITPDTDIKQIVKILGGEIISVHPSEMGNSKANISVHPEKEPLFTIRLSSLIFPLRERFSLAHELGHLFLHSYYGEKAIQANQNGASQESSRAEEEANWFASAFLMPPTSFAAQYTSDNISALTLAAYFQMPIPVVETRMAEHDSKG